MSALPRETDFEVDTDALFKEMENELRNRAIPSEPHRDARALQADLRARTADLGSAAALAEARRAAFEEGKAAADAQALLEREAAIEAALESERTAAAARLQEALDVARADWTRTEGERLAAAMTDQIDRLGGAMRMTLLSILRPLALNARQRQSIDDLVAAIAELSFDGRAMSIRATGPADLLGKIEAALAGRTTPIAFVPADGAEDVRIEIGQSVLQSRLAEWRDALETALA